MTTLEVKKIQAELASVHAAKLNLEVRIEESLDTIKKLEEHIKIQVLKEIELKEKLNKK